MENVDLAFFWKVTARAPLRLKGGTTKSIMEMFHYSITGQTTSRTSVSSLSRYVPDSVWKVFVFCTPNGCLCKLLLLEYTSRLKKKALTSSAHSFFEIFYCQFSSYALPALNPVKHCKITNASKMTFSDAPVIL